MLATHQEKEKHSAVWTGNTFSSTQVNATSVGTLRTKLQRHLFYAAQKTLQARDHSSFVRRHKLFLICLLYTSDAADE